MKPIVIIDFDGALLRSEPFDNAHKEWFKVMGKLLSDESVNDYAFRKDYFDFVDIIMKRYLGNVSVDARNFFARNIYAMSIISLMKKEHLVHEFAEYLRSIKGKYRIALITTAPAAAVVPILEKVQCADIFDIILKSPMDKQPSKKDLVKEFIEKYGMPQFYIGKGDKDINTFKDLGIKTITVDWVTITNIKGDFDVKNIEELDTILKRFEYEEG